MNIFHHYSRNMAMIAGVTGLALLGAPTACTPRQQAADESAQKKPVVFEIDTGVGNMPADTFVASADENKANPANERAAREVPQRDNPLPASKSGASEDKSKTPVQKAVVTEVPSSKEVVAPAANPPEVTLAAEEPPATRVEVREPSKTPVPAKEVEVTASGAHAPTPAVEQPTAEREKPSEKANPSPQQLPAQGAGTGGWVAPESANKLTNPLAGDPAATREGKKLFNQMCSICHGNKGKGDGLGGMSLKPRPTDLTSKAVQQQSDGAIFWKISEGKPPMAPYKGTLSETQRWQLVNYIRQLAGK